MGLALKGIVFDLDGTLVDSLAVTFDAFNHGIVEQGGKVHTPEELLRHFGPGEGEIFAQIVGRNRAEAAYEACRRYLDENLERVPMHPGVPELLDRLEAEKIPMAIFTGRSWNTTEVILKHHKLLDRFVCVIANDHVKQPKPHPEGLELATKQMKLNPEHVLFVGDSPADMHAARSARSLGVAALWDLMAKREHLKHSDPRFWAEKPEEVWKIWADSHLFD